MVTPYIIQAGCRSHNFHQLTPDSVSIAQTADILSKGPHYHFNFFISSLMKRIFANFTPLNNAERKEKGSPK
jgi:hypothetical protein